MGRSNMMRFARDNRGRKRSTTNEMSRRLGFSKTTLTSTFDVELISTKIGRRTKTLWDTEWRRPNTIGQEPSESLSRRVELERSKRRRRRRRRNSPSESFKQEKFLTVILY